MKPIYTLLVILALLPSSANSQLMNIIGGANDTIPCSQPCAAVTANYVQPLRTNTYQASSIPFSPVSLTGPTNLSLLDDKFSGAVSIGFPFCFYNNQYTNLYISANGHITFNPTYSLGNCSFDTKQGIPFYNATYPDNAIFCPFSDGNTSIGGTIRYQTMGTAPFRKFVVQYTSIPFFGTACTGNPATFQCVLSETSNEIEIFITNKSVCNTDTANWLNYATLGIQSTGANNFLVVNNRNANIWSASNEGWKISPNGPNAYTMKWYNTGMLVGTNVTSISVCNPFPRTIIGVLTLDCPAREVRDTITLHKLEPKIDSVVTTPTSCKNFSTGTATIFSSGGTPPYTYSIDGILPFVTSNFFPNLSFGGHYVQMKDSNGCIHTYSFFIDVVSDLAASIDTVIEPYCPLLNGSLYGNGNGGQPPYTYLWSTNQTTSSIHNLGPGSYTLWVTDAQGCLDSITYLLEWDELSLPFITDSVNRPVCGDSTGSIYLNVTNGTPPYTYSWNNAATTQNITNLFAGSYNVTVTDSNGCPASKYWSLTDTLNLQLQMTGFAHTTCGLNNGFGSGVGINGLPPIQYLWSNNATTSSTNTLSSGWQYLTVTDANGCTRTDSLNLNPSIGPTIQFLPANAYCELDNGVINTLVSGNSGWVSYAWSNAETTQMIDSLAAATYVLTITDSLGCVVTDSVALINTGKPNLQVLQYIKPLCFGDSTGRLLLGGTGGVPPYKYSFDGINFSAIALVTNFSAGTYKIYIRDANSCVSDTTILFAPPKKIDINTGFIDTLICYHDVSGPITFIASDGTSPYQWSLDGNNYQPGNTFSGLKNGMNTIYVKDSNNCENSEDILIPGPSAPLEVINSIENVPCYKSDEGSIEAQINGGWPPYNYNWSHSATSSLSLYDMPPGNYTLSVIDDKGCQLDSILTVEQNFCCDSYYPNAFTPNGDNNNDIFRAISPATDIEKYNLSVYNRWGNRVFQTDQIENGWNGTMNGEIAPVGTYFYKARLKCQNKKEDVFLSGDVILIR